MTEERKYLRFSLSYRIEHLVLIISFGVLGLTGLVQKYAPAQFAEWLIAAMGGIESTRIIHRIASIVMMLQAVFHIGNVGYKLFVLRVRMSMLPGIQDVRNGIKAVLYNLGISKDRPLEGRYTFAEKMEYWAVIWGTIVMGVTGFMLWNPIATARFLPGEFIPAAKAAHGGEALLAVLAIIVWHLYHVHIRNFNKSIFTGYLTEEEMLDEHPAELEEIKAGIAEAPVDQAVIDRRRPIFFLGYGLIAVAMLVAIYFYVSMEETAIATVPPPEDVQVYAPLSPTPIPTPMATMGTDSPMLPVEAASVPHAIAGKEECHACHGTNPDLPLPEDHRGRGDDFCHACHAPVEVPAILHPVADHADCMACHGEGMVAEFKAGPHDDRDSNDCQSCHSEAGVVPLMMPHQVELHEDCLACHGQEAFDPYPENHSGWINEFCVLCHNENPALAEQSHPFPQDHVGSSSNCTLCHVDGDLTQYSCDTCHQPARMADVHGPRGITTETGNCALCHPTGQVP